MPESHALFPHRQEIRVRALFIGERIDLKALESADKLGSAPLLIRTGLQGCAALFRYGAVVFFGLEPLEEVAFLKQLEPLIASPYANPETEQTLIRLADNQPEGIESGAIVLNQPTLERLQLVAEIMAKSVALAYYEAHTARVFDRVEPLAVDLQQRGRSGHRGRELLRYIGDALRIQHRTVGRAEIGDKPELLWEHPELERLFHRLSDEYELDERQRALDHKIKLISDTAETLLDLLHNRRSLRVEWYIVILILVEIMLTLYELFFRH